MGGVEGCFSAVVGVCFGVNISQMTGHGIEANEQSLSYLRVRFALGHDAENLYLARGQYLVLLPGLDLRAATAFLIGFVIEPSLFSEGVVIESVFA
jgi:hypothetical protein